MHLIKMLSIFWTVSETSVKAGIYKMSAIRYRPWSIIGSRLLAKFNQDAIPRKYVIIHFPFTTKAPGYIAVNYH